MASLFLNIHPNLGRPLKCTSSNSTEAIKLRSYHSNCSHKIKRRMLLGRKAITNLDSIIKSRDMTLPTKVHIVKAMVFPDGHQWMWGSDHKDAAAAAKSCQSCPTLCDPIDSSPPGSPIPGILQARTLEWVAISFSKAWKWKVKMKLLSRIRLLATPWTAAHQAPPSMGFSRQEYWSGVPLPSPKDGWAPKNWCFQIVVLGKTLESPLDSKEIKATNLKRNQPWISTGRTDADAEAPVLWPLNVKNRLTGQDSDAGKDWGQEGKGATEDKMVGWHHQLNGYEFEQTWGDSEGQGSLAC